MKPKQERGMQVKTFNLELKEVAQDGTFTGYGSVFGNVDSYGDVITPGAFKKTLTERGTKVKLLWQHNMDQPIGIYTDIHEDSYGLFVTGQLNLNTQLGAEAYALLQQGALDGLSIGFQIVQQSFDETTELRTISEIRLWEISLVTFPANELAEVTTVKSAFEELDQKDRISALKFINNLKSSRQQTEEPLSETEVLVQEQHSDAVEADTEQSEEPHKDMYSLEQLLEALTKLKTASF